jgi:hypothetical protein
MNRYLPAVLLALCGVLVLIAVLAAPSQLYVVHERVNIGTRSERVMNYGPFFSIESAERFIELREVEKPSVPLAPCERSVEPLMWR